MTDAPVPRSSSGSKRPALEWFPDAPRECPCCGGDFVKHNDEDADQYEAWEYECGLSLGRGKYVPFTAFEDCNNATTGALDKHNQALLAQRIEHEPSKLGVEGSNPSERAMPHVTTFNEGCGGVAQAAPEPVAYRWQYGADRRWEYSETQRKNTYHQMEPLYTSPPEALPAGENTKIRAVLRDWQNQLAEFEAMKARGDLTKDWGECSLISARRIVGDLTQALPSTDRQPGPLVPWELKCRREVCAAPECDCPAASTDREGGK